MIGVMAATVEAESVRCCILSVRSYTLTLLDNMAFLESMAGRRANCTG